VDIERFWEIIETAGGASCEDRAAAVTAKLVQLGREETAEFVRLFDGTLAQLYTWDLWAVAYIIQGGCSDDGFEYFRGWVISQGRRAHSLALSDPGALGLAIDPDSEDEERECEDLLYAGVQAYEELTGDYPNRARPIVNSPAGVRWEEDELEGRFPAVYERWA
jgi:hypothetical protein